MEEESRYPLLQNSVKNRELLQRKDNCDKYDYLAAVVCGAIGGMMDIFFVGSPGSSVLGRWTDEQVAGTVMGFARKLGWNPKAKNVNNINSAIGFLEQNFRVNYDQRKPADVGGIFNIAPNTHHMMSLAHSPDIVGLFFSILNQFTSTSSFIAEGQLVTVSADTKELCGGNFVMKIMCGIANWFGHLMSDIAGSSGSHGRGMGIVMPFYEFFGVCKFGNFSTESGRKDLAEIAMQAFTKGYDFRFGMTQAIPLIVTELSIRLVWVIRQRFCYHRPMRECIPANNHADLRVMLLVGNGVLCVMDGVDAGVRSGGNFLMFFMRLNLVAWFRFATLVLKEVFLRVGIADALQMNIQAFQRINEALLFYLHQLEQIDIKLFKKETEQYKQIIQVFSAVKRDEDLAEQLLRMYDYLEIEKPWKGEFDAHMANKNGTLVFE